MKIGIVTAELDEQTGGLGTWCCRFVRSLAARGYELHIIAQRFGAQALPNGVTRHLIRPTKSRIAFAETAERRLASLPLDLVHDMGAGWSCDVFQSHGGSHAAWLGRRLDMYSPWWRAIKRPIDALLPRHRDYVRHGRKQYALLQRSATKFIALSNMVANDFVGLHGIRPEQIAVVYNGVDCQHFSPHHRLRYREITRRGLGVDDGTLLLLLAAHNFRLKGLPEVLAATARLVANHRPVHLAVVGGKRSAKWQRTAAKLGLAGHVTFVGSANDIVPYYAAADVYVHPTYYDPCSLVLLEAAASGLPIVTTRKNNGAAELFREGHAILTVGDPSHSDALYANFDALFDERLRNKLGAAAREVALQHPFERNVDDILQLYQPQRSRRLAA